MPIYPKSKIISINYLKYEETPGWADFKTIIDDILLEDAGIDDILSGKFEGDFEIYSIDGKLITKNSSREHLKTLPKDYLSIL